MDTTDRPPFDPRRARNLISLKTAAELVEVDSKTIRNWIKAGVLQGFRVNDRLWRVNRDEVLALARPVLPDSPEGAA
ncbi:helix-turn-helix domain-containing protein [Nocardia sp. NPDC059228]|uniref:helix-turn-helix domain-containing protein n=1 Tax=Nocardia sp. NPDC059228 TaxID=3346777 RepID=UPI00368ECDD1